MSRALAVAESRSGAASPHLLPLLERLAGAQVDGGALSDATASRRRALKIAVSAYGSTSTNAANAMIALAELDILQHRYVDAEPLLIAATDVLSMRLGDNNPAMSAPLAALARIALARGEVSLARSRADRANAVAARGAALRSSEPLRVLGATYAAEERFDEGERALRLALARDRRKTGDASSETARSLAQLANLLLRAQRFGEALPLIEQAIAIDQAHLGETHPLIADDFADLGLTYVGLGRDTDAAAALTYAITLLNRGAGRGTSRVAYAELELAGVLRRLGQTEDADAAFKDAKSILNDAAEDERLRERQI
ncbi:MAG TPA: tetratricopeptide repeat protein [Stellaceae bacterium]|nr:tetratricopeptide repeat protein [Stellaceae bacterium]